VPHLRVHRLRKDVKRSEKIKSNHTKSKLNNVLLFFIPFIPQKGGLGGA